MGGIIGITGTPGTGKKTVSPLVARRLKLRCVSLNDLALSYGLRSADEGEVDTRKMRRMLARGTAGPVLLYGHLLPYVLERRFAKRVVVLRCEPAVLKRRLVERGYPPRKVTENVEAELIGVISADAHDLFGSRTSEADTTRSSPLEAAKHVTALAMGTAKPGPRIDWTAGYDSGAKLRSLIESG